MMTQVDSILQGKALSPSTRKCPKWRRIYLWRKRAKAQSLVEFALICIPFFVLLFAIFDYSQIMFYTNCLENGLREAARFATTGAIIQRSQKPNTRIVQGNTVPIAVNETGTSLEASRNECIEYWFQTNCIIHMPPYSITVSNATYDPAVTIAKTQLEPTAAGTEVTLIQVDGFSPATFGPGQENDFIQIRATYSISTITPFFNYLGGWNRGINSKFLVVRSTITKNEPAALNFEHTNYYSSELPPQSN